MSLFSWMHFLIADAACAWWKYVVAEMQSLRSADLGGNNDIVNVTRRARIVDEIALDEDLSEWRIIQVLPGVEFEGRAFVAPHPVCVSMAEI